MIDICQQELDDAPELDGHKIIRGLAYHENVIYECYMCRDDLVCMWKHSARHPKKRTLMLLCGIHTVCDAWKDDGNGISEAGL